MVNLIYLELREVIEIVVLEGMISKGGKDKLNGKVGKNWQKRELA